MIFCKTTMSSSLILIAMWDFAVPVCMNDLVKTGGVNQYVVQDVLSPKQLHSHLNSEYPQRLRGLAQSTDLFTN